MATFVTGGSELLARSASLACRSAAEEGGVREGDAGGEEGGEEEAGGGVEGVGGGLANVRGSFLKDAVIEPSPLLGLGPITRSCLARKCHIRGACLFDSSSAQWN